MDNCTAEHVPRNETNTHSVKLFMASVTANEDPVLLPTSFLSVCVPKSGTNIWIKKLFKVASGFGFTDSGDVG